MSKSGITLNTVLQQFRSDARNNRDLGHRFGGTNQQFLRVDPPLAINLGTMPVATRRSN